MEAASHTAIDIKDSILDAVGDTPLVRLSRLGHALKPQLVAKVEALNPGGSIKDRAAVALIEALVAAGSEYAASVNRWNEAPHELASRRITKLLRSLNF